MMMQMLGAFAEFERAMVRERTRAGLDSAREQGRVGGRRSKFNDQQRAEIIEMLEAGRKPADVARLFSVHRATIARLTAAMEFERVEELDDVPPVRVSILTPKSSVDRRPPYGK